MLSIDVNVEDLYACGEWIMISGKIIKCGKCGCEYDTQFHNGYPQCGFGKTRTVNIYDV